MKPNQKGELYSVSWDQYEDLVHRLAYMIETQELEFDDIYGIPRGGLVLAVMLSHRLGKPLWNEGEYGTTLAVDDIVDTGKTLRGYLESEMTLTASLFLRKGCPIQPTVYAQTIEEGKWVLFPYETVESTYT